MRAIAWIALGLGATYSAAQMERSIDGRSADHHHESVFDSRTKLYLYSGGD